MNTKSDTLNTKKNLELGRALFHFIFYPVAVALIIYASASKWEMAVVLAIANVGIYAFEKFRRAGHAAYHDKKKRYSRFARCYEWFKHATHGIIRPHEITGTSAMVPYVLGLDLVFCWVMVSSLLPAPFHFALLDALFIMTVVASGDPFARIFAIMRKNAGKQNHSLPWNPGKSWEGFIAFCVMAGFWMVITDLSAMGKGMLVLTPILISAQVLAIIAGAVTESVAGEKDNFWISLFSLLAYQTTLIVGWAFG